MHQDHYDPNAAVREIMQKAGWPAGNVTPLVTPRMLEAGIAAVTVHGMPGTRADLSTLLRAVYEAMDRAR